jgi:hypothetical protein
MAIEESAGFHFDVGFSFFPMFYLIAPVLQPGDFLIAPVLQPGVQEE